MYEIYNLIKQEQIEDLSREKPQTIDEIRKIVVDAIVETFSIDPTKIYTEGLGETHILFNKNNIIYEICYFEVDSQNIRIYFEDDAIEYAGLGKINAESAKAVAKNIKEKLRVNMEIRIYSSKLVLLHPDPSKNLGELIDFLRD
ncbi:MAG: hypothetical protein RXO35_01725 [Candidatus Micrarchaeota archaeon]